MPFEFQPSDWLWEEATIASRQERLEQVIQEVERQAGEIVKPHGLKAEVLRGIFAVGVQGDARTRALTLALSGPYPGHDVIAGLSTQISNTMPVNRVTVEFARATK